jgi:hypothetical protein
MGPASANGLHVFVRQNQCLADILERFDDIALPDAWLVAGCIAQTIWNLACGQPAELGIKDVDLIYFDAEDISVKAEAGHERRLRDLFRHLPIKLDVKNEARVHLWYQQRFGYAIAPYRSSADAIATFPTTATQSGYAGYMTSSNAAHPLASTICAASLSDQTKGRSPARFTRRKPSGGVLFGLR